MRINKLKNNKQTNFQLMAVGDVYIEDYECGVNIVVEEYNSECWSQPYKNKCWYEYTLYNLGWDFDILNKTYIDNYCDFSETIAKLDIYAYIISKNKELLEKWNTLKLTKNYYFAEVLDEYIRHYGGHELWSDYVI